MAQGTIQLHNRLRKHRKMMGYSIRDVAWLLNLKSANRISQWEQGKTKPSIDNLLRLGILYRSLTDQLYEDYRSILRDELTLREQELAAKKKEAHV